MAPSFVETILLICTKFIDIMVKEIVKLSAVAWHSDDMQAETSTVAVRMAQLLFARHAGLIGP